MSIVNIISAIGNNSSVYPLIVRDCAIEIPSKVALTYNQNLKDSKQMAYNATRERLIDEYATSFIWIAGPAIIDKICNWSIKKIGFAPEVNAELFKERTNQGLKYNIEKFKNIAPKEVKDMEKILKNKSTYQKLLACKFGLSTAIPIALMGFLLPKLNFKLTEKLKQKQAKKINNEKIIEGNLSFKGITATLANVSHVNKMAITDGGLTVGRVSTARNKYEKMELGFKNIMMMSLNFVFPIYFAKFMDSASNKLFNTNVNLDPKLIDNKEFIKSIKENKLTLPNNSEIIDFLDKNPKSEFSKLCEKYCGVKRLSNGIRDPRYFVNEDKIIEFKNELEKFAKEINKGTNPEKFAKKALRIKSANILTNIGVSSFLLAVALPKLIFFLREKITGSDAEPGLV